MPVSKFRVLKFVFFIALAIASLVFLYWRSPSYHPQLSFVSADPLQVSPDGKINIPVIHGCLRRKFEVSQACQSAGEHTQLKVISMLEGTQSDRCLARFSWGVEIDVSKVDCEFDQIVIEDNGTYHEFSVIR